MTMDNETEPRQEPKTIAAEKLRVNLRVVLDDVKHHQQTYVVTLYGKPVAVIAPTILDEVEL